MQTIKAIAAWDDPYWIVQGIINGQIFHTQAETKPQISEMIHDIAQMESVSDINIEIEFVPLDVWTVVADWRIDAEKAAQAELTASAASRKAVTNLREHGYSLRKSADVMGLSFQRVSQLAKG